MEDMNGVDEMELARQLGRYTDGQQQLTVSLDKD